MAEGQSNGARPSGQSHKASGRIAREGVCGARNGSGNGRCAEPVCPELRASQRRWRSEGSARKGSGRGGASGRTGRRAQGAPTRRMTFCSNTLPLPCARQSGSLSAGQQWLLADRRLHHIGLLPACEGPGTGRQNRDTARLLDSAIDAGIRLAPPRRERLQPYDCSRCISPAP